MYAPVPVQSVIISIFVIVVAFIVVVVVVVIVVLDVVYFLLCCFIFSATRLSEGLRDAFKQRRHNTTEVSEN